MTTVGFNLHVFLVFSRVRALGLNGFSCLRIDIRSVLFLNIFLLVLFFFFFDVVDSPNGGGSWFGPPVVVLELKYIQYNYIRTRFFFFFFWFRVFQQLTHVNDENEKRYAYQNGLLLETLGAMHKII